MANFNYSFLNAFNGMYENKLKSLGITITLEHGKNPLSINKMYIYKNNTLVNIIDKLGSICKHEAQGIFESLANGESLYLTKKEASFASNKGEASHDGKSRDKQRMTYCKKSSDETKDIINNIIKDKASYILQYEIKNKIELKILLYRIIASELKTYNNFNIYLTPCTIKNCISNYLIYNENKINEYMKKYNLKTSNNNDYALCLYNAVSNNKIIELV